MTKKEPNSIKNYYDNDILYGKEADNDISLYIPSQTNPLLKRIIKIIAIAVLLTFSWQQITWAQGGMFGVRPRTIEGKQDIVIPKELGITQRISQGTSDEVVINIQDAHDSLSAQYGIVDITASVLAQGVKSSSFDGGVAVEERIGNCNFSGV